LCSDLRGPSNGHSIFWPLSWAIVSCIMLVLVITRSTRNVYSYSYPDNYLRVIQNLDPCQADGSCGYRFIVQGVFGGATGQETEMHFCPRGMQPRFEAGHILAWIRYANLGSCQAIDGYDVLRDESRIPIIAPNCQFDWPNNHIVCEGGKAKFE